MSASDISSAFVDGIYEVYSTFYSTDIVYYPFDINTPSSIYGENAFKKYLTPVTIVGFPSFYTVEPSRVERIEAYDLTFDIPAKSFISASILTEDLTYLSKGLFLYLGKYYRIESLQLGSVIQDVTLNYIFNCFVSDVNGN